MIRSSATAALAVALALLIALSACTIDHAQGQDTTLTNAVRRIKELREANRYPDAVVAGQRAIERNGKAMARELDGAITLLQEHGFTLMMLARYAEAETHYRRALDLARASNPQHPFVYVSLVPLAQIAEKLGRMADAEAHFKETIAYSERVFGPGSPDLDTPIEALAEFYERQARLGEAERERHRAFQLVESVLGPSNIKIAAKLRGLARLIQMQGRPDEAEPLLRRAVAIGEAAFGAEYPLLAGHRADLANALLALGRSQDALPFARQAADGMKQAFGIEHIQTADILRTLGRAQYELDMLEDAQASYRDALVFFERRDAPRHIGVARALSGLADVAERLGNLAVAEALRRRALDITEGAFGKEHAETAAAHQALGSLNFDQGKWAEARDHYRRAMAVLQRIETQAIALSEANTRRDTSAGADQRTEGFIQLVRSLSQSPGMGKTSSAVVDEAFISAQRAGISRAARAVAQMASRQATSDGELAQLVRERQDLTAEWRSRDRLLIEAVSKSEGKRNEETERRLRDRLAAIEVRMGEIDRVLRLRSPNYAALALPEPLAIEEVQGSLGTDDVLILYMTTMPRAHIAEETFIWVVTKHDSRWVRSNLGANALTQMVQALRCGLDEEDWSTPTRAGECGRRLGMTDLPESSEPLPFDLAKAHELYQALLSEAEDLIRGKHLLIVPSGPLTSFPFHVLVTEPVAEARPRTFEGYRNVAWLGRKHAISVLPAVSSLKALRDNASRNMQAEQDYVGYGDPVLQGDGLSCRAIKVPDLCPSPKMVVPVVGDRATVRGRGARRSVGVGALAARGGNISETIQQVRMLCPLPDTAYEIRCISRSFPGTRSRIRLDQGATEADIKAMNKEGTLARYRVVHFATHGLLASDVERMARGRAEPALVMTPPSDTPQDADDDGLLTASEVTELKLNADWVVLSACNTAASDGSGAEALSGLARAFIYAGARALLVSHWPVYSDAAVRLTTNAFSRLDRDRGVGRAEAMRQSIVELIDDTSQPDNTHPAVWAPFVVVGEGAAVQ
jgi:CHAT domain-containing protein